MIAESKQVMVVYVPEGNAVTFVVKTESSDAGMRNLVLVHETVKRLERTNTERVCVCNCIVTHVLQMMNSNSIPVLFLDKYSTCTDRVLAGENIGNNV